MMTVCLLSFGGVSGVFGRRLHHHMRGVTAHRGDRTVTTVIPLTLSSSEKSSRWCPIIRHRTLPLPLS